MSGKPRKKYRPRPVNPVAAFWTLAGQRPITESGDALRALMLAAHESMLSLVENSATRSDIERLAAACNVVEGAHRCGLLRGTEHLGRAASELLPRVAARQPYSVDFDEAQTLNQLLELHDALLNSLTYAEFDQVLKCIKNQSVPSHPHAVRI